MSEPVPTAEDLESAASSVREHVQSAQLGVFAYTVLASLAQARATPASPSVVQELAREHAIDHELAETEAGNVLVALERGPGSGLDVALVSAFATAGFGELCRTASSGKARELSDSLVRSLAWIELATPYRITPFLGLLLAGEVRALVEDALLEAILKEDGTGHEIDSAVRARNAARITSLVRAQNDAARAALARVRGRARDPATRALAIALLGEAHSVVRRYTALRVSGVAGAPARRLGPALFRWLSGIALLSAVFRLLCFLLALRSEGEIELEGGLLRARSRTTFLGRTVRSSEACYSVDRISGALRRARFALLRSSVGVLSLSLGILLGGHLLFDAARGGAPWLLIAGASVVFLGAAVDLALEIWLPARAGQVELQVDLHGARSLRLSRVPIADADALLAGLSERVALGFAEALRTSRTTLGTASTSATRGIG